MQKMKIELLSEEMDELNKRLRSHTVSVRDQRRAKVILLAAQGKTQEQIASEVNLTRGAVGTWCRRFMKQRLLGLSDMKGRGRKTSLSDVSVKKVLDEVVFIKDGSITLHSSVDDIRSKEGKSVDTLFREVFKC